MRYTFIQHKYTELNLHQHELRRTKRVSNWNVGKRSWEVAVLPESGSELRSAHRTMGMEDGSEVGEPVATEPEALSAMLFSSDRNIMVWINLTSEYSGSQCMWALATRISCLSCDGFMPENRKKGRNWIMPQICSEINSGLNQIHYNSTMIK